MPALMTAADALVENAGGLTCMEAFAVGLPVITFLPIAGHGKDNAEMMARAGVNRYARDEERAARRCSATVTRPGPERDALVDTARGAVRGRPGRRRRGARRRPTTWSTARAASWPCRAPGGTPHGHDRRRERARALRRPHRSGAQAVSAIGVGVAKPPKHATSTVYVGVRLDHAQLDRPRAALADRATWASPWSSTRRRPATARSRSRPRRPGRRRRQRRLGQGLVPALEPRAERRRQGGQGDRAAKPGTPAHEFVPGSPPRRVRPVLVAPRRSRSWSSPTSRAGPRACPTPADREGLRARRSRPRPDGHGGRGGRPRRAVRVRPASSSRRSGSCAEAARATVRLGGAAGLAGAAAVAVVHAAPALGGVSPVGVRFTPALVGVGRQGSRRAHVRRRSRPRVDAAVPRRARRARVARDVLHAR